MNTCNRSRSRDKRLLMLTSVVDTDNGQHKAPVALPLKKNRHLLNTKLGGSQRPSGIFEGEKNPLSLRIYEPRILQLLV
jgi:hypothetical protein